MSTMSIVLEDWQRDALSELARSRGVAPEALAQSLLAERLVERIHCAFDDLLSGAPILLGIGDGPDQDTIENRLRRLFEE